MMDLKFVLDLKDHPTLSTGFDAHEKGKSSFTERAEFLRRSLENLKAEADKYEEDFWKQVTIYAQEKQILPADFKADDFCFHYQEKHRQVFMHEAKDHQKNPLEALFTLLGKGPPS